MLTLGCIFFEYQIYSHVHHLLNNSVLICDDFCLKNAPTDSHISGDILDVIVFPILTNTHPAFLLGMQTGAEIYFDVGIQLNYAVGVEIAYVIASLSMLIGIILRVGVPFSQQT